MPSSVQRALQRIGADDLAAGLIAEQIDRVRRVMPQQVIGPGARLPERIRVGAAEEERLHVHLLDLQLAARDALVDPLVRRIEATRVPDHADEPGDASAAARRPRHPSSCRRAGSPPARACRPSCTGSPAPRAVASACKGSRSSRRVRDRVAQLRRRVRNTVLLRDFLRRRRAAGRRPRRLRHRRSSSAHRDASARTRRRLRHHDLFIARSPGSCGPRPCSTRARDRSDALRAPAHRARRA